MNDRRLARLREGASLSDALLSRPLSGAGDWSPFLEHLRETEDCYEGNEELVSLIRANPEIALNATAMEALLQRAEEDDPAGILLRDALGTDGRERLLALSAELITADAVAHPLRNDAVPAPPPHLLEMTPVRSLSHVNPGFLFRTAVMLPVMASLVFFLAFDYPEAGGLLHWAARRGVRPAVWLLPRLGWNPSASNERGVPPLWYATEHAHEGSAITLLRAGAQLRPEGYFGSPPMGKIARAGQLALLAYLFDEAAPENRLTADDRCQMLVVAAEAGRRDTVEFLLDRGVPVDGIVSWRGTALAVAAAEGRVETMRLLLARGAKPDGDLKEGRLRTPLQRAARNGRLRAVELLLEAGADPKAERFPGNVTSLLQEAASSRSVETLERLFKAGAPLERGAEQRDPCLHRAAESDLACTRWFLDHGVPVNCRSLHGGGTALHAAAAAGRTDVVTLLLERGADLEAKDADGLTPLQRSLGLHGAHMAAFLLDRGARVPEDGNEAARLLEPVAARGALALIRRLLDGGMSAPPELLLWSARSGRRAMIDEALRRGLALDVRSAEGRTVLHEAVGKGDGPLCTWLLDRGIPLDAATKEGETALHRAIFHGNLDAIRVLLARGAALELRDVRGLTPFLLAAKWTRAEIMPLLAEAGADRNARTPSGWTGLHLAVNWNDVRNVDTALALGLDPGARDREGDTPLHVAVVGPSSDVIARLLAAGADPNATNATGETPLHRLATIRSYLAGQARRHATLLVGAGASLEREDGGGVPPLRRAIEERHFALATVLLELGADPRKAGPAVDLAPSVGPPAFLKALAEARTRVGAGG